MIGNHLIRYVRRLYFKEWLPIKEILRRLSISRSSARKVARGQAAVFKYDRGVQPAQPIIIPAGLLPSRHLESLLIVSVIAYLCKTDESHLGRRNTSSPAHGVTTRPNVLMTVSAVTSAARSQIAGGASRGIGGTAKGNDGVWGWPRVSKAKGLCPFGNPAKGTRSGRFERCFAPSEPFALRP